MIIRDLFRVSNEATPTLVNWLRDGWCKLWFAPNDWQMCSGEYYYPEGTNWLDLTISQGIGFIIIGYVVYFVVLLLLVLNTDW